MDNKIKYSCSKEDEERTIKIKLEITMDKFEECLNEWIDLEEYIYTLEYRQAFIDFALPKLKVIDTKAELENLVTMTLHHETGDRRPYFEFDRGKK